MSQMWPYCSTFASFVACHCTRKPRDLPDVCLSLVFSWLGGTLSLFCQLFNWHQMHRYGDVDLQMNAVLRTFVCPSFRGRSTVDFWQALRFSTDWCSWSHEPGPYRLPSKHLLDHCQLRTLWKPRAADLELFTYGPGRYWFQSWLILFFLIKMDD